MPLHVLTDADVLRILLGLSYQDVVDLGHGLAEALHEYSTGDTNAPCCASFQPQRTVIKKKNVTSLFMPASTGTSIGMKVVSLETPETGSSNASTISKKSSISSATSGIDALELTPASTESSGGASISGDSFRPSPSVASTQTTTPKGLITVMDATGNPQGIINAEEVTAFRTALGATFMLQKREKVHTITIFGAGKQAYWHLRLALMLRAKEIHHINIINRSVEKAIKLMRKFQPGNGGLQEWSHVKFSAVSPEFGEYGRLLKEEIRKADVIFCCTPSTEPLFPHEFLTSHEGRRKGRYISAIGSYAPHMIELHPEIIKTAVKPDHGHRHHHKHARQEGVIIVDTLDGCLKEAGEIIQAKLTPDQLVEVGELIMVKKSALKEIEAGGAHPEPGLLEWLTKGNVIYKSVGLGLMDLVVGGELIRLGRERNIGTNIPDF
ncbi:hypothetical protein H2198_001036 [Neophaeococcomyces mojaviensis]|uniref:Uncharacterized protein n=1 Tax=Neophaeococcomyces mojaviensis TaxID=3383035 RepID=A0ACC3AI63_9EURO|nr:hypothetical protein H2198_001036 [Knufia sp. JES_112]